MALYNIDIHNGLLLNEKHQNRMSVCSYILNTALGYGTGLISAFLTNIVLGHGRNLNKEIELRKGK